MNQRTNIHTPVPPVPSTSSSAPVDPKDQNEAFHDLGSMKGLPLQDFLGRTPVVLQHFSALVCKGYSLFIHTSNLHFILLKT